MTEQSSKKTHKEHLSKEQRLPRCYKDAEKVLKAARTCQGNIKTILYSTKLRGGYFNKIYALTHNVLKNTQLLDKIIEETHLLTKEPYLKKELAQIMIYDMVMGKGQLSGKSKPVLIILKYKNDIESAYQCLAKSGIDRFMDEVMVTIPRYARINTLLTTMSDVLDDLKKSGYYHKEYQEDISDEAYLDIVKNLKSGEFLIDYHFKDLLVFPCKENLRAWDLYNQGHIFLQDKSSCIPVCVLSPEPGSNVVDACAAPGMKTAHLAALMKNKGQIFAYEKDSDRFAILKSTLIHGNVKICKTFCKDFRTVDPADDKNANIDYILLDPTCSGSGMVSRMDAATDTENSKNEERLLKLAGFQIVLLKHALKFPNVKRVVYSTCSVTEQENEYVVHEALSNFQDQFRLVNIMPDWSVRGSTKYEYGNLCLRAYSDKNLTNGFFVAMFERIKLSEVSNSNTLVKMPKHKKNKRKRKSDCENDEDFLSSNSQKRFKNNNCSETNADDVNSERKEEPSQSETLVKKKHKKKHKSDRTDTVYQISNDERKNFCEVNDFSLPVVQKELQRNNCITNNVGNLNLEKMEKTEGTHQSECHIKRKHKKKNNFGSAGDGDEKNNFVENGNGDDFHSSTSQKQCYKNANNIENVNVEQMKKTKTHQSEIHIKKKCKKKHKSDETDNSEEKKECIKYEDGNDFHSSISNTRNILSTSNVNLEEIENEELYQSNTHVKKKCKKKHKYDDRDMQCKRNNGEEKSNCEENNDFFSSASQKQYEKKIFAADGVENVDSEQKEERKETYTPETHVKKKCKKKHKSNKTEVQDSQKHFQKNNCEEIKFENSNSEQTEEMEETYQLDICTKKKRKKKSVNVYEIDTAAGSPNSVIENVNTEIHVKSLKKMKKCNF